MEETLTKTLCGSCEGLGYLFDGEQCASCEGGGYGSGDEDDYADEEADDDADEEDEDDE